MPTKIFVPKQEMWDETREIIIPVEEDVTLSLEHSLVSLTKWESKWHKPFLSPEEKTQEETMDYVRCMILNEDVDDEIIYAFKPKDLKQIETYIATDQTATTFPKDNSNEPQSNEIMTSELIYYYLAQMQCPFVPTENWHLSRVLTLIRIGSFKSKPEKKLNHKEAYNQCESIREKNMRYFEEMKRKEMSKFKSK